MQGQLFDVLHYGDLRFSAHAWHEQQLPALLCIAYARAKRVAKEVKTYLALLLATLVILAIDNMCFLRMQF